MNFILFSFVFIFFIHFINCATLEVSTDGTGLLDLPLTFGVRLIGEVPLDVHQFSYVFEDRDLYPRHREEVVSGRETNFTVTYNSKDVLSGTYYMKVQVYVIVWGIKGWLIAEDDHQFVLQNSLTGSIDLYQSDVSNKTLRDSIVATNRTVELSASIEGQAHSHLLRNASFSYTWVLDSRTFVTKDPEFSYNFTSNQTYDVFVVVMCNITEMKENITKLGQFSRQIRAKNEIKALNVIGNTWLKDGALLHLSVNCTGGDQPFWYCYEYSKAKPLNYTCSKELIHSEDCYFPITHYFPKNGTYYISIAIYNDINFINKTISVIVYDPVRQTQLMFVIIPIVSSILAIIIVVLGIAFHLRQRQRQELTLEVADFDFQTNDNLMEKTFFERLRDSLIAALRETFGFIYPCNPCIRSKNYDEMIDDSEPDPSIRNNDYGTGSDNTSPVSNGVHKN